MTPSQLLLPTPGQPNLAPVKALIDALDRKDTQDLPFDEWFTKKSKALDQQDELIWRELTLSWQMVTLFLEGKQVLRKRHRGVGWEIVPVPESTMGSVYAQNKLSFYSQNLLSKWVSSRTEILTEGGDDTDETEGASRAAKSILDHYARRLYSEKFRQTEALGAQSHGTYARYFYYSEDEDGGVAKIPVWEEQQFKLGEDTYQCLDCGSVGLAGDLTRTTQPGGATDPAQQLVGAGNGISGIQSAAGSPSQSLLQPGANAGSVLAQGNPMGGQPQSNPADPAASAQAISGNVYRDQPAQAHGQPAGTGFPAAAGGNSAFPGTALAGGLAPSGAPQPGNLSAPQSGTCPNCQSPNAQITPAPSVPLPVVTGYQEKQLGDLVAVPITYNQLRHEISCSPETSPWLRWRRRLRLEIIKAKFPGLKIGHTDEQDPGLAYEEQMRSGAGLGSATQSRRHGTRGEEDQYADFTQWWFRPEMYADYIFPVDTETVSGQVIPAGTQAIDLFPDGMYVATCSGINKPLQVWNENHQDHFVSAPYHLRLFTGLGRGIEDAVEFQRQWNLVTSLIFTQIRTAALPGWLYDSNAVNADEVQNLGRPQSNVPASLAGQPEGRRLSDLVHQMTPGTIPPHLEWYVQHLDNGMQSATNAIDFSGAIPGVNNDTATGAQIGASLAQSMHSPELALKADADVQSGYKILKLFRKHCYDARYIKIKNKHGLKDGEWFSAADLEGEVVLSARPDSWIPKTPMQRQENFEKAWTILGGLQGYLMAKQAVPEVLEQVQETFDVDFGEDFEAPQLLARIRLEQAMKLEPEIEMLRMTIPPARVMPSQVMPGQDPDFATEGTENTEGQNPAVAANQNNSPNSANSPSSSVSSVPSVASPALQPVDIDAELGAMLAAAIVPPVDPYELGHLEAINWLRAWLSTDEGIAASKVLRECVHTFIQQHLLGLQMEQAQMSMMAMAGQPPMQAGQNDQNQPPSKSGSNDHRAQARANMKAPKPGGNAPAKQPRPQPQSKT